MSNLLWSKADHANTATPGSLGHAPALRHSVEQVASTQPSGVEWRRKGDDRIHPQRAQFEGPFRGSEVLGFGADAGVERRQQGGRQ
jgi:hypothetical protein